MHSILAVLLLLVMGQAIASDSTRENIEEILNGLTLPDYTPQASLNGARINCWRNR